MEDFIGRSFTAQLRTVGEGFGGAVKLSPNTGVGRGGWLLVAANAERGDTFTFEYLRASDGRFHYAIKGADNLGEHAGAALGISTNGYLGLYQVAGVNNSWKIEVRPPRGVSRPMRFWLRSAAGYRIAAKPLARTTGTRYGGHYSAGAHVAYLNANTGVLVEFELHQITLLD